MGKGDERVEKIQKEKKYPSPCFFVWQHRRGIRQAVMVLAGTVGLLCAAFALSQAGPGLLLFLRGLETMLLLSKAGCD